MLSVQKWFNIVLTILGFCLPLCALDFGLTILHHFQLFSVGRLTFLLGQKWKSKMIFLYVDFIEIMQS